MIPETLKSHLVQTLALSQQGFPADSAKVRLQQASGGDINNCFILQCDQRLFFVKLNCNMGKGFFQAEAEGLNELRRAQGIYIPRVITLGEHSNWQYLILEYLDFCTSMDDYALGQALASMHRFTSEQNGSPYYGFKQDNFIGRTPQKNSQHQSWLAFWENCRLLPQLKLAYNNGFKTQLEPHWPALSQAVKSLLHQHQPKASILHGDLWGGNKGFIDSGTPVIFDPAVYYGDRETDLAMTELFGGFSSEFYRGYHNTYAIEEAFNARKLIYNLYHQLNHLNLFGSGYLSSCITGMTKIISMAK